MEKVEYADINKFLVSTGLMLVTASIAIPYFFLKESFGLDTDKAFVHAFTPEMQAHFYLKQWFILKLIRALPLICSGMFLFGLASVVIGLKRWFARQSKIDKNFDLTTEKLVKEIESMTPAQVVQKTTEEIRESEVDNADVAGSPNVSGISSEASAVLAYLNVEQKLYDHLKIVVPAEYEVMQHKVLGMNREVDLIIKSKSGKKPDIIGEVKFAKSLVSRSTLLKAMERLGNVVGNYYQHNPGPLPIPWLIVIYGNKLMNLDQIANIRDHLESKFKSTPLMKRAKVSFVHEADFGTFDPPFSF